MTPKLLLPLCAVLLVTCVTASVAQQASLREHVLFYSSFDGKVIADVAVGDAQLYTAANYKETDQAKSGLHNPDVVLAKDIGLSGDALYFTKQNTMAIYYDGSRNLGYSPTSWSGTVSFWLQVDPEKELAPGYCDPINLTDHRFDDAALWVDFTKGPQREFRLGVLGDLTVWNPENKNDPNAIEKRTVTLKQPPFASDKWTHIVITYSEINTDRAVSKLYVDGTYQGEVNGVNDPFTWEEEKAKIMLGLGYIGKMDELAVFDKALDAQEVQTIYGLKAGLKSILK